MASKYARLLWITARRTSSLAREPSRQALFLNSVSARNTPLRLISSAQTDDSSRSPVSVPTKETLLRIDWMVEAFAPLLFKGHINRFFDICKDDVELDDRIYKYKMTGATKISTHIGKFRMYFRMASPFNKFERIGSCIYEGEDVVVLLWKFTTVEPSFSNVFTNYLPSFITRKEAKMITTEGALDIHVNSDGRVYKIINRKITAADREGARVMAKIKEGQEEIEKKRIEKELRDQGEAIVEEQRRRGHI